MATYRESHGYSSVGRPRDQLFMAHQQPLDRHRATSVWSSSVVDAKRLAPAMEPRFGPPSTVSSSSMVSMESRRSRKPKDLNGSKTPSSCRPSSSRRRSDERSGSRDSMVLGAQLEMPSTRRAYGGRPGRFPAAYDMAPRQTARIEDDLASIGSWSYEDSVIGREEWSDCPPEAPSPPGAPCIPRLPTPELGPLSTDFEFCHCHGDEPCKDGINEAWYLKSRAKVNSQVDAALAYIARSKLDHAA